MELVESRAGKALVVQFIGRLDAVSSGAAQARLLDLIQQGEKYVIADLQSLQYISSAGLRIFMMAAKQLRAVGGQIALCGVSEPLKEIFEIAGFTSFLAFFPEREAALLSFG